MNDLSSGCPASVVQRERSLDISNLVSTLQADCLLIGSDLASNMYTLKGLAASELTSSESANHILAKGTLDTDNLANNDYTAALLEMANHQDTIICDSAGAIVAKDQSVETHSHLTLGGQASTLKDSHGQIHDGSPSVENSPGLARVQDFHLEKLRHCHEPSVFRSIMVVMSTRQ